MKDHLFWWKLASLMTAEFGSSEEKSLRRFWVDDFIPESAVNTRFGVDVEGIAWIPGRFHFVASIPQKLLHRRRDHIAIHSFVLDESRQTLRIELNCSDGAANEVPHERIP